MSDGVALPALPALPALERAPDAGAPDRFRGSVASLLSRDAQGPRALLRAATRASAFVEAARTAGGFVGGPKPIAPPLAGRIPIVRVRQRTHYGAGEARNDGDACSKEMRPQELSEPLAQLLQHLHELRGTVAARNSTSDVALRTRAFQTLGVYAPGGTATATRDQEAALHCSAATGPRVRLLGRAAPDVGLAIDEFDLVGWVADGGEGLVKEGSKRAVAVLDLDAYAKGLRSLRSGTAAWLVLDGAACDPSSGELLDVVSVIVRSASAGGGDVVVELQRPVSVLVPLHASGSANEGGGGDKGVRRLLVDARLEAALAGQGALVVAKSAAGPVSLRKAGVVALTGKGAAQMGEGWGDSVLAMLPARPPRSVREALLTAPAAAARGLTQAEFRAIAALVARRLAKDDGSDLRARSPPVAMRTLSAPPPPSYAELLTAVETGDVVAGSAGKKARPRKKPAAEQSGGDGGGGAARPSSNGCELSTGPDGGPLPYLLSRPGPSVAASFARGSLLVTDAQLSALKEGEVLVYSHVRTLGAPCLMRLAAAHRVARAEEEATRATEDGDFDAQVVEDRRRIARAAHALLQQAIGAPPGPGATGSWAFGTMADAMASASAEDAAASRAGDQLVLALGMSDKAFYRRFAGRPRSGGAEAATLADASRVLLHGIADGLGVSGGLRPEESRRLQDLMAVHGHAREVRRDVYAQVQQLRKARPALMKRAGLEGEGYDALERRLIERLQAQASWRALRADAPIAAALVGGLVEAHPNRLVPRAMAEVVADCAGLPAAAPGRARLRRGRDFEKVLLPRLLACAGLAVMRAAVPSTPQQGGANRPAGRAKPSAPTLPTLAELEAEVRSAMANLSSTPVSGEKKGRVRVEDDVRSTEWPSFRPALAPALPSDRGIVAVLQRAAAPRVIEGFDGRPLRGSGVACCVHEPGVAAAAAIAANDADARRVLEAALKDGRRAAPEWDAPGAPAWARCIGPARALGMQGAWAAPPAGTWADGGAPLSSSGAPVDASIMSVSAAPAVPSGAVGPVAAATAVLAGCPALAEDDALADIARSSAKDGPGALARLEAWVARSFEEVWTWSRAGSAPHMRQAKEDLADAFVRPTHGDAAKLGEAAALVCLVLGSTVLPALAQGGGAAAAGAAANPEASRLAALLAAPGAASARSELRRASVEHALSPAARLSLASCARAEPGPALAMGTYALLRALDALRRVAWPAEGGTAIEAAAQQLAVTVLGRWNGRLAMARTDRRAEELDAVRLVREADKNRKLRVYEALDEEDREFLNEYKKIMRVDWAELEERAEQQQAGAEAEGSAQEEKDGMRRDQEDEEARALVWAPGEDAEDGDADKDAYDDHS